MFERWRKYSYADQKRERYKLLRILLAVVTFFLVYSVFSRYVFETVSVENSTMMPGLQRGDRLIVLKFGFWGKAHAGQDAGSDSAVDRGDIVLVTQNSRLDRGEGAIQGFLRQVVRFFTAQRIDTGSRLSALQLKRVVGLPGDQIAMADFVCSIRAAGSAYAMTEHELIAFPYDLTIRPVPDNWREDYPLSPSFSPIQLGNDDCFLLSDDRSCSDDSRAWGPVPTHALLGKAVFRYWPFARFGSLD